MSSKIIITPKTKVGELLDNYPDIESVLMKMSPAFEKLRNPILRKTIARVATLQQVALVGGLNVNEMINILRKEVGQVTSDIDTISEEYLAGNPPDWFDSKNIVAKYDASPIINSGGSPMNEILHKTSALKAGEIFELTTPFVPAPILDILKAKGYRIYCTREKADVICFITR